VIHYRRILDRYSCRQVPVVGYSGNRNKEGIT